MVAEKPLLTSNREVPPATIAAGSYSNKRDIKQLSKVQKLF